ncbi:MAG: hypothetical protein MGU50_18655 [Trichodesmium sp. MAG_R02]|nr:hypothetical protein [Trichodesmium sp. MAG_R02]
MILSKKRALLFLWRSLDLEKALGVKAGLFHSPKLAVNFWIKVMFFPP